MSINLEEQAQERLNEKYDVESSESFEFDMATGQMVSTAVTEQPSAETPPTPQPQQPPAPKEVTTTVSSDAIEGDENVRVATETLEMDFDTPISTLEEPVVEAENDEFSFDSNVDEVEAEEVNEGGDDNAPETDLDKALKRIEELENKQKQSMTDKEFEAQYSKEKIVMPNISEYDYATLGKELGETGALSEETYSSLSEKGYSKEIVDNHIKQAIEANTPESPSSPEKSEDAIKSDFAKELKLDIAGLDSLLADVKNVFTDEQVTWFDNLSAVEQSNQLLKFQNQRLVHNQKIASKKLIKGNAVAPVAKDPYDGISNEQIVEKFNKAMRTGNNLETAHWGKAMEIRKIQQFL